MRDPREQGFTIIELLTVMALFSVIAVGFYQVMFSATASSERTRSITRIAEEARHGFNRILRDTRETTLLNAASATSYEIFVDYDGNRTPAPVGSPNPSGDYEVLTFAWNSGSKLITINGETLIAGVDCIRVSGSCTSDVFVYTSNLLQYDWNTNGVTSWQELDEAGCASRGAASVGDCDTPPVLDVERAGITNISYAFQITVANRTSSFYGEAQLRNRR